MVSECTDRTEPGAHTPTHEHVDEGGSVSHQAVQMVRASQSELLYDLRGSNV